jgi:hypothetical protein
VISSAIHDKAVMVQPNTIVRIICGIGAPWSRVIQIRSKPFTAVVRELSDLLNSWAVTL